jgi:hypothetical protein
MIARNADAPQRLEAAPFNSGDRFVEFSASETGLEVTRS